MQRASLVLAATALAGACLPTNAAAAITVRSRHAVATVQESPFALKISDRSGRVLLEQAAGASRGPLAIPPAPDPLPGGGELGRTPALYAPLAFVVGAQPIAQIPAGPWMSNVLTGTQAGTAYAATAVTGSRPAPGGGVGFDLATTDPGGRRIALVVAPGPQGGIRVSAAVTPASLVAAVGDAFAARKGEAFRGFGGRHNELDQRGSDLLGWVQQQNTGAGSLQPVADGVPGSGGDRYLFPNGRTAAYYVAPSFVSDGGGYSFLLRRDELSRWRMASDRADAWTVQAAGAQLEYLVLPGKPSAAIRRLTAVTGRHRPPPAWALRPMLDRSVISFTQTTEQYQQQVRDDLAKIDELGIRIGAYRVEGWDAMPREAFRAIVGELRKRGIRPVVYFRAFVAADPAGTEDPRYFQEAVAQGYTTKTAAGTPYLFGGNFFGPTAIVDFTNPAAVEWWQARIKEALDLGADGFMQDFGEQVMQDMRFADGSDGRAMHNRYPALFHKVTREAVTEWERANPGRGRVWFFTRAGYAGADGSARYEGSTFAGDGNTDFSRSSGLASQAPDMLNRALAGATGFTTDIGGYFDYVSPETTKELLIRWAQWAVFSPIMRLHGSINAGTHMPWNYDAETVDEWKRLSALRERAVPLIAREWRRAHRTGMPITRPLWLAAPEAPKAAGEDQQWLVGRDLLVAPVVTEGATSREVSFPRGCWRHGETGRRYRGPARVSVPAPLRSLPHFVRCSRKPLRRG